MTKTVKIEIAVTPADPAGSVSSHGKVVTYSGAHTWGGVDDEFIDDLNAEMSPVLAAWKKGEGKDPGGATVTLRMFVDGAETAEVECRGLTQKGIDAATKAWEKAFRDVCDCSCKGLPPG